MMNEKINLDDFKSHLQSLDAYKDLEESIDKRFKDQMNNILIEASKEDIYTLKDLDR